MKWLAARAIWKSHRPQNGSIAFTESVARYMARISDAFPDLSVS
jgi:hypothetical protein